MFNRLKERSLYRNIAIVILNLFVSKIVSLSFQNTDRPTKVILFYISKK